MPYANQVVRKEYAAVNLAKWREEHPDKVSAQRKRSYARNRAKRLAEAKAYNEANRALINSKHRARRKADPLKVRATNLWSKHKLTLNEFAAMSDAQGGLCFLCGDPGSLCVDHDHKTGKIRKLLCTRCNVALGYFEGAILELGIDKILAYLRGEV